MGQTHKTVLHLLVKCVLRGPLNLSHSADTGELKQRSKPTLLSQRKVTILNFIVIGII